MHTLDRFLWQLSQAYLARGLVMMIIVLMCWLWAQEKMKVTATHTDACCLIQLRLNINIRDPVIRPIPYITHKWKVGTMDWKVPEIMHRKSTEYVVWTHVSLCKNLEPTRFALAWSLSWQVTYKRFDWYILLFLSESLEPVRKCCQHQFWTAQYYLLAVFRSTTRLICRKKVDMGPRINALRVTNWKYRKWK